MYGELWEVCTDRAKNGACDMPLSWMNLWWQITMVWSRMKRQFSFKRKPEGSEVVLDWKKPTEDLIEAADYASEIRKVKHPF